MRTALYQLGGIISGASAGFAARRFGMRRLLLGAATLYALGCVASALAPEIGTMLVGRLVQGLGGGAMIALTYVATQVLFPERLWTLPHGCYHRDGFRLRRPAAA